MFPPETVGVPKVGALQGAAVVVDVVVGVNVVVVVVVGTAVVVLVVVGVKVVVVVVVGLAVVVVVVVAQEPLAITTPTVLICTIKLYPKDGTYKLYHKFAPLNGVVKLVLV